MTIRLITAGVGIPGLLIVLWLGTPAVGAVALVAAGVGGWELAGMARGRAARPYRWLMVAWPAAFVASGWLVAENEAEWWLLWSVAAVGAAPAFAMLGTGHRSAFLYAIAAGPYVGITLAHAPILRSTGDGGSWLLLALLVTFAADSAAMFTGLAIGRHRLAPRISPGKTWEGTTGGLVAGGVAAMTLAAVFDLEIAVGWAVVLGVVMAMAGTLGDLGESAFKRNAGVKDSGILIPGHGGILDRLDSLMPNLVIVYWVSEWSAN
ncbi:MAG: CDP-archaeol synthase [Chloroflexi bacterium]|nr:CDP-archaeol synthase [Chloroflexota bacterium]